MDLRAILIPNCVGVVILLILLYASRVKTSRRQAEDRLHTFMVVGVMLGCLMEMLSYIIDGKVFPGARVINYIANTYLFSVNLLLPFSLLLYVDLGLYDDVSRIWKHYKPQITVGLVMLGVNILNFFVPVSYYITEQNVYERRPMSYVYYAVILYYCVSAVFLTRRYERENGARAFFSISMFLLPILLGAGLQFLFYGLSLAWLSAAVGLVGLFMMQQNEMAYVDALTDTYNRQYLSHTLSAWISRNRRFTGVMLDIDRFKSINDSFGHSEGDRALKTVADILKAARRDHELVFRFAGDEFIILKLTGDAEGLAPYLAEVDRLLEERKQGGCLYPIALSYGMSHYETGGIDAFMKDMDEGMYRMKVCHHGAE